eukprot:789290-Amorphochlora_amoeboformis.AAC.1
MIGMLCTTDLQFTKISNARSCIHTSYTTYIHAYTAIENQFYTFAMPAYLITWIRGTARVSVRDLQDKLRCPPPRGYDADHMAIRKGTKDGGQIPATLALRVAILDV